MNFQVNSVDIDSVIYFCISLHKNVSSRNVPIHETSLFTKRPYSRNLLKIPACKTSSISKPSLDPLNKGWAIQYVHILYTVYSIDETKSGF